jgi:predicted Zn-dependent protease
MTSLNPIPYAMLLCMVAACATSPTGRTQFLTFSEQNAIAASRQAYTEMITPLANEKRINTDAKLNARVKRIVDRLVPQAIAMRPDTANWDWTMTVIDDPKTINAWAMAGGKMALYTGLVAAIKPSDDELAQVLGHEIAHALAKHSVEKMSVAAVADAGVKTVGIATDSALAMQGSALVAALAVTLPNSRSMESEADQIGIELAARAGYDPAAAVTLWDKMAAVGGSRQPQFLSTHPNPATRKTALQALVPQMRPVYEQAKR